jgi:regulatory protein
LEWLLNRPHSEREFRDYLYRKKTEPEQLECLVEEMTGKGYLDNAKFAAWFIELQGRRGKSDRAIRAELFRKGISGEMADGVITENAGGEVARLRRAIEKKRKLSRYKNDPQKLMQYLVGKGFSWQLIKEQLAADQPEENT